MTFNFLKRDGKPDIAYIAQAGIECKLAATYDGKAKHFSSPNAQSVYALKA